MSTFYYQSWCSGKEKDGGLLGLVHRSINQSPLTYPPHELGYATRELSLLIVQLCDMLIHVPQRMKQIMMGYTLGLFGYIGSRLKSDYKDINTELPWFPTSMKRAKTLLIGDNKKSLWSQLPCPRVITLDDNAHVVISLDEMISQLMASGEPLSFLQDDSGQEYDIGINGCKSAKELLKRNKNIVRRDARKTAFGYLIFWSDAFITAWVKQKDNSAW